MSRHLLMALLFLVLPGCAEVQRLQAGAQAIFGSEAARADESVPTSPEPAEQAIERAPLTSKTRSHAAAKDPWDELIQTSKRHCTRMLQPSPALLICDVNPSTSREAMVSLEEIAQAARMAKPVIGIASRTPAAVADLEQQLIKRGLRVSQRNTSSKLAAMYRIVFERK